MKKNINDLVQILEDHKQNFSNTYRLAFKKFVLWHKYIKKIIQESKKNPNIIAMAFTQKLIAYSGIIESLKLGNSPVKKFESFFNLLDEHEKFLVMMAVKIGKTDKDRKQREERIVNAYLKNSLDDFNSLFRETVNISTKRGALGLYNLRCRLVHQGEFVLAMTLISNGVRPLYYSQDLKLKIDESVISLDEMFLMGFYKIVNISAPSLISRAKEFLRKNHYTTKTQEYLQLFKTKFDL